MSQARRAGNQDQIQNLGWVSKASLRILRNYYDQYVEECQQLAMPQISFSGFVIEMAVRGYLYTKQIRHTKLKKDDTITK